MSEEDWQYRKRRALRTVALYENSRDVLRVLDALTANGNLRDYDDEMANRVEDAKDIVRAFVAMFEAMP
jgi:hypothetical protein